MDTNKTSNLPKRTEFVNEFLSELNDHNHKRIMEVYLKDDSVSAMESELSKILLEIISDED